jgi:DNA-binding NarL/FixJ family response regulator
MTFFVERTMLPPNAKPKAPPRDVKAYRVAGREDEVVFVWRSRRKRPTAETALTASERAILELVVRGCSNQAIAAARSTSVRTVANQVASLLRKLGAASRYELLTRYE